MVQLGVSNFGNYPIRFTTFCGVCISTRIQIVSSFSIIPTLTEFQKLLDTEKVVNEWITINGVNGRKFSDKITGNFLFLPVVGYRIGSDGSLYGAGAEGEYWSMYWSSTQVSDVPKDAYSLTLFNSDANTAQSGAHLVILCVVSQNRYVFNFAS